MPGRARGVRETETVAHAWMDSEGTLGPAKQKPESPRLQRRGTTPQGLPRSQDPPSLGQVGLGLPCRVP